MRRINLLEWRDIQKKERETRFGIIAGIALGIMGLIVLGVHVFYQAKINYQESRNNYLTQEIKFVEKQIEEIEALEKKKAALINRMSVIQELESSRPKIVHLFDELVKRLPDGVHFTSMTQKKDKITLEGVAQSDARVSSLMRKIEESEWLKSPEIKRIIRKDIKEKGSDSERSISEFELELTQTFPKGEGDDELGLEEEE